MSTNYSSLFATRFAPSFGTKPEISWTNLDSLCSWYSNASTHFALQAVSQHSARATLKMRCLIFSQPYDWGLSSSGCDAGSLGELFVTVRCSKVKRPKWFTTQRHVPKALYIYIAGYFFICVCTFVYICVRVCTFVYICVHIKAQKDFVKMLVVLQPLGLISWIWL
jgi:hypothetical protein